MTIRKALVIEKLKHVYIRFTEINDKTNAQKRVQQQEKNKKKITKASKLIPKTLINRKLLTIMRFN